MLNQILAKVIGTQNDREIKRVRPQVGEIGALEPQMQALTDEQIRGKTLEFRQRIADGESLDDLLVEAFALVREAGKRVLNMRHFDLQFIGGMVLLVYPITSAITLALFGGIWLVILGITQIIAAFAKRVQSYNNGLLPPNPTPSQVFDRYSLMIVNNLNTGTEDEVDDESFEVVTDNQPFIGVASQSRGRSVLTYYGIERHSNWIFTPLFRGTGSPFGGGRFPQFQQFPGGPQGLPQPGVPPPPPPPR